MALCVVSIIVGSILFEDFEYIFFFVVCVVVGVSLIYLFLQVDKDVPSGSSDDTKSAWEWMSKTERNAFRDFNFANQKKKKSSNKSKSETERNAFRGFNFVNQKKKKSSKKSSSEKKDYKTIYYSNNQSLYLLACLISQIVAVDGETSDTEYDAACRYLQPRMDAYDYHKLVSFLTDTGFSMAILESTAKNVGNAYAQVNGGLYFVTELLYSIVIVSGINPKEWEAMCKVLDIFFPKNDDDYFYFIDKYQSYERGGRPYNAEYARRLKERKQGKNNQNSSKTSGANRDTGNDVPKQKSAKNSSYYSILGLTEDATQSDIRKRYHELAKKYHPDVTLDELEKRVLAEKFIEIQKAYNALRQ